MILELNFVIIGKTVTVNLSETRRHTVGVHQRASTDSIPSFNDPSICHIPTPQVQ